MAAAGPPDLAALQEQLLALGARFQALEEAHVALQAVAGGRALSGERMLTDTQPGLTYTWVISCASQVFLMQAGFALVEAGTCRAKNVLSILIKNQIDFLVSGIAWLLFGYGLAFGDASITAGLAGSTYFLGEAVVDSHGAVTEHAAHFHFQQMFCAVSSTIVSGGIAERASMRGYLIFSSMMSMLIYPIIVCWCWNPDGWLYKQGFFDYAGSGVVHLTGGVGALAGSWVLGPRAGRFADGRLSLNDHEFSPHNVPFIAVGTMILQYGWYGFNSGSTGSMASAEDASVAALAAVNTTMGAVAGGVVASLFSYATRRKWDVPFTCNGILAGLVSVTACAAAMQPWASVVVATVGTLLFGLSNTLLHRMRIDDPVGAFSVHGVGGAWGILSAPAFHMRSDVFGRAVDPPKIGVQMLGAFVIVIFSGALSLLTFSLLQRLGLLGTSLREERRGLDNAFVDSAYSTSEVSRYRAFVSHAKGKHGATARWFQLELGRCVRGKGRVFLDSDNLVNLNQLLSTVRDKVDVLVVLASEELWWRPWCAAEITVASMAQVPIILVLMDNEDQKVDFRSLAASVADKLGPREMEVLAPFGIAREDVIRAYEKLVDAPQVPFSDLTPCVYRTAIRRLAMLAEMTDNDSSNRMACTFLGWLPAPICRAMSLAARWLRSVREPKYIILCDEGSIEAVAAAHICQTALLEATSGISDFQVACSLDLTEAELLMLITNGATIILLLSAGVLGCQRVQRACLVRAAALSEHRRFPGGISSLGAMTTVPSRAESSMNEGLVLVHADRLGFEFPEPEYYESLLEHHPHLSMAPEDSLHVNLHSGRLFPGGLSSRLSTRWAMSTSSRNRHVNERFAWSRLDLPYESDEQCAVALQAFYKSMLSQIALPLSTHGSWKAIKQQVFWIYERSIKIPTIHELAARNAERGFSPSRSSSRRPSTVSSSSGKESWLQGTTSDPGPRGHSKDPPSSPMKGYSKDPPSSPMRGYSKHPPSPTSKDPPSPTMLYTHVN